MVWIVKLIEYARGKSKYYKMTVPVEVVKLLGWKGGDELQIELIKTNGKVGILVVKK